MAGLEHPVHPSELYIARGEEVNPYRPIMQGDVFPNVAIPGVDAAGAPNLAIVVQHPCSMRKGHALVDRLKMVRIRPTEPIPLNRWADGHYRLMPLPELVESEKTFYAASLDEIGRVPSADLDPRERIACLSARGLALMQQRMVHSDTRVQVDTPVLLLRSEPVLEEIDLLEEWCEELAGPHTNPDFPDRLVEEAKQFDQFLSEEHQVQDDAPYTLRKLLGQGGSPTFVRREVRRRIDERRAAA